MRLGVVNREHMVRRRFDKVASVRPPLTLVVSPLLQAGRLRLRAACCSGGVFRIQSLLTVVVWKSI